ncbi:uncharacterized protein LOC113556042 [Rhopalosiphum maidis]|uniref:uncharacterized protein LOC113556042 n=1 Tax=Rhopalosiphum maidis TaxID=43146 RepID=UPI000EFF7B4F|nr:uncharacterized protein LOC113556042 [Rhopalosiphum maidis]
MDSLISHVGKYQHPTLIMDSRMSRILKVLCTMDVRQFTLGILMHGFTYFTRGKVSTSYVANGLEDAENNTCYMQYGSTAVHLRNSDAWIHLSHTWESINILCCKWTRRC